MMGVAFQQNVTESFGEYFRTMPSSKRPDKAEDGFALKTCIGVAHRHRPRPGCTSRG